MATLASWAFCIGAAAALAAAALLALPLLLSASITAAPRMVSSGYKAVECKYVPAPEGLFFNDSLNFALLNINLSGTKSSIGPVTTIILRLPDGTICFLRNRVCISDEPPKTIRTRAIPLVYEVCSSRNWADFQKVPQGEAYELTLDAGDFIDAYRLMLMTEGKDVHPSDAEVVGIVPISDRYLLYNNPSKALIISFDGWASKLVGISIRGCKIDGSDVVAKGPVVEATGLHGKHAVELELEAQIPVIFWWRPAFFSRFDFDFG